MGFYIMKNMDCWWKELLQIKQGIKHLNYPNLPLFLDMHAGSIGVTGHLASFFNYSDGMIVDESQNSLFVWWKLL